MGLHQQIQANLLLASTVALGSLRQDDDDNNDDEAGPRGRTRRRDDDDDYKQAHGSRAHIHGEREERLDLLAHAAQRARSRVPMHTKTLLLVRVVHILAQRRLHEWQQSN